MKRTSLFNPHDVSREDRPDGTILLRSNKPLGPVVNRTGDWLHTWAAKAPDHVFLAERSGAGWRTETYATTHEKVRALGQSLLARGLGPDTPILILSGNGVDHGLLALAGQYVGIPTVPVAEQYALIPAAHDRLRHVIGLVNPGMAYVSDAAKYAEALKLDALQGLEVIASTAPSAATAFDGLLKGDNSVDVDAAFAKITPDTVAKILMTSGSTSNPKGVLTTQRMLCVNQTQIADSLPFLNTRAPRIVDWLPWNHTFGGSHNFNLVLANGGSLYIDDGKPMPGLFERTLENLSLVTGTLAFNVPVGYAMLLRAFESDSALKQRFFADLDMLFYAGASLPQDVWQALEQMAMEVKGEVPLMTSSWGLTETAPATMIQQEPTDRSGVIGVPMTGVTLKLVPDADLRCEVRVKGPNIMPGYLNDPSKTQAAFDKEGFFCTDDAMVFVDPKKPNKGLRFDGRISEDFKLLSGTWVQATALRAELLQCLIPLAADVIVTGHDRNDLGAMIIPNQDALQGADFTLTENAGLLSDPDMLRAIKARLAERNKGAAGASRLVRRAAVLAEPPSLTEGEITAKGNLNFAKLLHRRAAILDRLYDDADPSTVVL